MSKSALLYIMLGCFVLGVIDANLTWRGLSVPAGFVSALIIYYGADALHRRARKAQN